VYPSAFLRAASASCLKGVCSRN